MNDGVNNRKEEDFLPASRAVALLIYEHPSRSIVCIYNYFLFYKIKRPLCILLHLVFFLRIYVKDYASSSSGGHVSCTQSVFDLFLTRHSTAMAALVSRIVHGWVCVLPG